MQPLFLTTPSSTGRSDLTPTSGHARGVVLLEQVAGVFFIALTVTRLVVLRSTRSVARAGRGGHRVDLGLGGSDPLR